MSTLASHMRYKIKMETQNKDHVWTQRCGECVLVGVYTEAS
jgi:hypothetical protein